MALRSNRVELVDALRGFALLAIVLLHNLEHYNLYYIPENMPQWLKLLDVIVWDTSFFMMAGKAFSTFALLFGFSFFIQLGNAERNGHDFRGRFAWRMVILILFSQLHALFYNGDILLVYACVGLMMIPFARASNKTILLVALFLLIQPFEWARVIYALFNPDFVLEGNLFMKCAVIAWEAMVNGSYLEVLASNITEGQMYNNLWQIENGRLFQTPALFLLGMLLGRLGHFVKSEVSVRFWVKVLAWGAIAIVPLYIIKTFIPQVVENNSILVPLNIAVPSFMNFAFMCILISSFSLLWFYRGNGYKLQRFIVPYGKMSLTNYITQSIIGCFIYLNYGLGLYKHTGATLCILIGLGIFAVQLLFSRWWLNRYRQGPLESVWKKLTWINNKAKK